MKPLLWKRLVGSIAPAAVLLYAGIEVSERSLADGNAFSGHWGIPLGHVGGDSWANLAFVQEQRGEDPLPALRRAVELSPADAGYRGRLGLAEEAAGDLDGARRDLVRSSQLSRKFEPWWNLLNFYFRREQWDLFWPAVRQALPMSYGDRSALFDLCLRAEGGAERLEGALPPDREIRMSYQNFVMDRGLIHRAQPLLEELASSAGAGEGERFRAWVGLLVQNYQIQPATLVWRQLLQRHVVTGDAFPWQAPSVSGSAVRELEGEQRQISLNGEQPEDCDLLWRIMPVASRSMYRFEWATEARLTNPRGDPSSTGLTWRIESYAKPPRVLAQSPELAAGSASSSVDLNVPGDSEAIRITLHYRRPLGSVRAEGRVKIERVRVTEVGRSQ
jgi:hypothetical protein